MNSWVRVPLAVVVFIFFLPSIKSAEPPPLPGPGLDIPADVDGDGVTTYGDKWYFNYWLFQGGSLEKALDSAKFVGDLIDLSDFFSGPSASLSPNEPVVSGEESIANSISLFGPYPDGGGVAIAPCTTSATMGAFFGGGGPGVQTGCVYEHATNLEKANGHTKNNSDMVYVTREVSGFNAGITKVNLYDIARQGTIPPLPIADSKVTNIIYGGTFYKPVQDAWDWTNNSLLFSESEANRIWRCMLNSNGDPSGQPTYEISYGLYNPYGIALRPPGSGWCHFGNEAELFIAENKLTQDQRSVKKYGVYSSTNCPPGSRSLFQIWTSPGHSSKGVTFRSLGAGYDGLYYVNNKNNNNPFLGRLDASNPITFSNFVIMNTDDEPSNLASDTYSQTASSRSLYYTHLSVYGDPGKIWAVKLQLPATEKLLADNLNNPQGISFTSTGVMLVSEQNSNRITVLDGWRFKFNRGDVNDDGIINQADAEYISAWVGNYGPEPNCMDTADVDDNGKVNSADAIWLLNYLYFGGPPPKPPFWGVDPQENYCLFPASPFGNPNAIPPEPITIDPTIDLIGCKSYTGWFGGCFIDW